MRIFVMHPELRAIEGHVYTECVGWRRLAQARRFELSLFGALSLNAGVAADTGATPLFGETSESRLGLLGNGVNALTKDDLGWPLETFFLRSRIVSQGCRTAWETAAHKADAVFFPWATYHLINGVADWLTELPEDERPAVLFNLVRPEEHWVVQEDRNSLSGDFGWFRFVVRRIQSLLAPHRFVFSAADPRLARMASIVGGMTCVSAPLHQFYPTPQELNAWRPPAEPPLRVTIPGRLRRSKGREVAASSMARVAAERPDVRFHVQVSDDAAAQDLVAQLNASGVRVTANIRVGALSNAEYYADLMAADLVLLPYPREQYAAMPSGAFADAVVCGAPVVAPAGTWISDRLDEGWGAGETFANAEPEVIAAAVLRASESLPALRAKARAEAGGWRRAQSLEAYVDAVLPKVGLALPGASAPLA